MFKIVGLTFLIYYDNSIFSRVIFFISLKLILLKWSRTIVWETLIKMKFSEELALQSSGRVK